MSVRTDLAVESLTAAAAIEPKQRGTYFQITEVTISNAEQAAAVGKPEGHYLATVPVEQLQRKFCLTENLLLGKTDLFSVRQKGVLPLLLPTSMLQLPRCLVRICNLFHKDHKIANLTVSKQCNCSRENKLQNWICFANVGYSPTLGTHFEKLLHRMVTSVSSLP